jgi:hypothetical protein
MNNITTIDMRPAPGLVRAALEAANIPLQYNDDHTVTIPAGPGFDSNGNMTVPEDHVLRDILNAAISLALEKHLENQMILPTNVARLRQMARDLSAMRSQPRGSWSRDDLDETIETLNDVADNLDPAKQR